MGARETMAVVVATVEEVEEVEEYVMEEWQRGKKGRLTGQGTSIEYNVANLTNLVQILVSLWPLCRLWNTTALIFKYHWDKEAG